VEFRSRQRQQIGKQGCVLIRLAGGGEQGLELLQSASGRVVGREPHRPAELMDEWI
jgi:hypothetical protein